MRKLVNLFFWTIGVLVVAAVYFFVPVGRYTLFEHTLRIAATEPAQELGEDVTDTASDLGRSAMEQWDDRAGARREAAGQATEPAPAEPGGSASAPMRLRVEPGGVRVGDELLSPARLRARVHDARHAAAELHAILESADGVPAPDVTRILALLADEGVQVERR